ncbi:PfkB family carbohydrate kinase [Enterococcus camelliae]|uniref:PfkB family carbohydrate kinase n=1 Tax=Enterococcus camelliae TaxID=453959 RepID=A0ABW5TIB7_9ENTE
MKTKILTLGEILLRLSTPKQNQLIDSSKLNMTIGGSETNVAISLANLGYSVSVLTVLPKNEFGKLATRVLRQNNVETSAIQYLDGRMGVYFLEDGVGIRKSKVIYDRANSAFARSEISFESLQAIFEDVSLFHISGITPALSPFWFDATIFLAEYAHKKGIPVSLDVNYRSKLWTTDRCREFVQKIAPFLTFCSAGSRDAATFFDVDCHTYPTLSEQYEQIVRKFPTIQYLFSTKRTVFDATHNKLKGYLYERGQLFESDEYDLTNIVDRVGGGDSFFAGVLFGCLEDMGAFDAIQFGTCLSAMKHTIYGDWQSFSKEDILSEIHQKNREIQR